MSRHGNGGKQEAHGVSESWRTGGFQEGRVCSHPKTEGRMSSLVTFLVMLQAISMDEKEQKADFTGGINWPSRFRRSSIYLFLHIFNMFKTYGGKERQHMEWHLRMELRSRRMVGETITCFRSRGEWLKMSHCFFMLFHLSISICCFFVVH